MPNWVGDLYSLGTISYRSAWELQKRFVAEHKEALHDDRVFVRDKLVVLEHPPVYTLGQGSDLQFIKFDLSKTQYELHRTERGGEVTYHCPGQLVGYPILYLKRYQTDLHWYLRRLEEVIIRTLLEFDLKGDRISGMTGVWVEGRKVAAIGIKVSQWITMHGFALNVCPNLSGFERIVPCGIESKPVGSMAQFLPGIEIESVRTALILQFEQVFGLSLELATFESSDAS